MKTRLNVTIKLDMSADSSVIVQIASHNAAEYQTRENFTRTVQLNFVALSLFGDRKSVVLG
jgi:hypothetical protein